MRSVQLLTYSIVLLAVACACHNKKGKENTPKKQAHSDFHFRPLTEQEKQTYAVEANDFYQKLLVKNKFSGQILIAKNGDIVFEAYSGMANYQTKEPITANTPLHLASISKTFTGMAVMKLWEDGRLQLEDSVQKFFPAFPYHNITVRNLLSHRSGLPNYVYFMDNRKDKNMNWDDKRKATNEDMLQFMIEKQPPREALPDRNFHYCNTNYALLALIVEKVTGQPFPQYMKDSLFTPLGMKNTFIFSVKDTNNYVPSYTYKNTPFRLEKLDCIYGDKNVYSTVRDMLLWDKAIYEGSYVSQSTLDTAFKPYSNEHKSFHNYGLGWRLYLDPKDTIIYHNGWWHGNNTVFTRMPKDTATIITIGNRYNRVIYLSRKIATIFSGKNEDQKLAE